MICESLQDHRHGLFALRRRWSLKVQPVFSSANLANNISTLFGGYAQNLQFSYSSGNFTEQEQGRRASMPLNMLLLLRWDATYGSRFTQMG